MLQLLMLVAKKVEAQALAGYLGTMLDATEETRAHAVKQRRKFESMAQVPDQAHDDVPGESFSPH